MESHQSGSPKRQWTKAWRHGSEFLMGTKHVECWVTMGTQKFRSVVTAIVISWTGPIYLCKTYGILLPILAVVDIPFTSSHFFPSTFDPLIEAGFSQIWQHNRKDANTLSYRISNQTQNICLLVSFTGILPPMPCSAWRWYGLPRIIQRHHCVFHSVLEAASVWTWTTANNIWKEHRSCCQKSTFCPTFISFIK